MRPEFLFLLLASCVASDKVHLFTAASMEETMRELAPDAVINAAASSALAKQIENGARADLFVSADREWAEYVAERTTIEDRAIVANNRLVLIAPIGTSTADLLSKRIALGDPKASIVPLSGVSGEMVVTVYWEISWYQYRVTPDAPQPVRLAERGTDVSEIDDRYTGWNARLGEDGRLIPDIARI